MTVELLNAGSFTVPAGLIRAGEPMDERTRCPVPAYLVETGDQRILIDTGLHPAVAVDASAHYGDATGPFELELETTLAEQVDLDTVTMVVLTHLHFDHAGGLVQLPPSVPVVIQHSEWAAGHDRAAIERNFYVPGDYAGVEDRRLVLVDGDHDLLGDGSIELLFTPGHTPGHQSVRIGDVVVGADVVHFASALDDHRFPVFGHDRDEQQRSAERLRGLRDAGLRVLPGHDAGVLRPGPLSPSPAASARTQRLA